MLFAIGRYILSILLLRLTDYVLPPIFRPKMSGADIHQCVLYFTKYFYYFVIACSGIKSVENKCMVAF